VSARSFMGKIEFRFSALFVPEEGQADQKTGCMLPASMLRAEMFFVRVNRFWCVWIRVPV